MKKILLFVSILVCSCEEQKPSPRTSGLEDVQNAGKLYRNLKDAFKKGYNDTTKTDSLK